MGGGGGGELSKISLRNRGGGILLTLQTVRVSEGQIFAKNSVTQRLNDR